MIFNSNISKIEKGADLSDATATASDIVSGKTAYVASGKVVGTLTELSNPNLKPVYPINITIVNNSKVALAIYTSDFSKSGIGYNMINLYSNATNSLPGYSGLIIIISHSGDGIFDLNSTSTFFKKIHWYGGSSGVGYENSIAALYPDSPNLSCTITVT